MIEFGNVSNADIDEFHEDYLRLNGDAFEAKIRPDRDEARKRFDAVKSLPPLATGFSSSYSYAIASFNSVCPSEFAFHYLALFLLSSLVRYRPQNWVHAISRTGFPDAPTDDQCLALIEHFLAINGSSIPSLVVAALNPHEDEYA